MGGYRLGLALHVLTLQATTVSGGGLHPHNAAMPCCPAADCAQPTSSHATRGAFATKHLFVTQYHPKEMNPAGEGRGRSRVWLHDGAVRPAAAHVCRAAGHIE